METNHKQVYGPAVSRLGDVIVHINRYQFKRVSRLAEDAGVEPSTISRLLRGQVNPSFFLVARITGALEKAVGYHIDPRDIISECGAFLTRHVCDLMHCSGCFPGAMQDEEGNTKPRFAAVKRGQWTSSEYPFGYQAQKEVNE